MAQPRSIKTRLTTSRWWHGFEDKELSGEDAGSNNDQFRMFFGGHEKTIIINQSISCSKCRIRKENKKHSTQRSKKPRGQPLFSKLPRGCTEQWTKSRRLIECTKTMAGLVNYNRTTALELSVINSCGALAGLQRRNPRSGLCCNSLNYKSYKTHKNNCPFQLTNQNIKQSGQLQPDKKQLKGHNKNNVIKGDFEHHWDAWERASQEITLGHLRCSWIRLWESGQMDDLCFTSFLIVKSCYVS